jgi:RND family efflux transporter MFP subunit
VSFHSGPVASLAALALCFALAACGEPKSEAPPPRTARVVVAEPAPLLLAAEGSGTVEARTTTSVGFLVSGRLVTRDVDIGSTVKEGDKIASIDPTDLKNQLEAAQAQVAAAQAAVDQAAPQEAAKRELLKKGFTTQADYNQALQALQSAQADLGAAQANLRLAQDQLKYADLTSPVAGAVTKTGADPGQVVQAGEMIVEIADISALDAVFSVSQRIANLAKIGVPVTVWLQSDPTAKVEGAVRQVSPSADPVTGTYTVRVGLTDPPPEIRIGSLVRGRAESTGSDVISVPPTALVQTGDKPAVWVVAPDTGAVTLTTVTVVRYDTDAVLISAGLNKGDLVVIAGVNSLAEGQIVKPEKVAAQ